MPYRLDDQKLADKSNTISDSPIVNSSNIERQQTTKQQYKSENNNNQNCALNYFVLYMIDDGLITGKRTRITCAFAFATLQI